jgi:hypothetical protein
MAIEAGSVAVDDVGNATGSGLALLLYNEQIAGEAETPNPPPKSGPVTSKKSIARFSNHLAAAIATKVNAGMLLELQLASEPVTEPLVYTNTISDGHITQELWTRSEISKLLKSIDYTYSLGLLETEVRKVYDADGTTVLAQVTISFSYSGSTVDGKIIFRDI